MKQNTLSITGTVRDIREFSWGAIGTLIADQSIPEFDNSTYIKFIGGSESVNGTKPDQRVTLHGNYRNDPRYGPQLHVNAVRPDLEVKSGGLAAYIANHPEIKGIGPAKAEKLASAYGGITENLAACAEDESAVAAAIGIKSPTIQNLVKVLSGDRLLLELKAWLAEAGLTHKQCERIVGKYGWQTKSVLETDPYLLIRELPGMDFVGRTISR